MCSEVKVRVKIARITGPKEAVIGRGQQIDLNNLLPDAITTLEMYLAHLDRMIEQTILGQRYSPGVELAGYLVLLEVRTLVAGCSELEKAIGYLKHGDDKGDHIMIDDNGNVVSVIDWEWSFITCKSDAFSASFALTDKAFRRGSNELSLRELALAEAYDKLGRADLGDCVRNGKKYQRLYEFFRFERDLIPRCISAMRKAFLGDVVDVWDSKQGWVEDALRRFAGDVGLKVIQARQKGPFPFECVGYFDS